MDKVHKVVWTIHTFGASSPKEAAQEALEMMRDTNSTAVVFDVYTLDNEGNEVDQETIDLLGE